MNKKLVALACIAWASAAISIASPATALIATQIYDDYASCTSSVTYSSGTLCFDNSYSYNYIQSIRFIGPSCNSGACSQESSQTHTDMQYSSGRKTTSYQRYCSGYYIVGLGTCSC